MNSIKNLLKMLLADHEANSRFVFLLHGIAGAFGVLLVGITYTIPHFIGKELGPEMIGAFGGVTGIAALGRWATKVGDGKQDGK